MPHQESFAWDAEPNRRRARGDNHGLRLDRFFAFNGDTKGMGFESIDDDIAGHKLRTEPFGLRPHFLNKIGSQDGMTKARIVFHFGGQRQLAACVRPLDKHRLQVGAGRIDGCGQSGGARSDDHHILHRREFTTRPHMVARRERLVSCPEIP